MNYVRTGRAIAVILSTRMWWDGCGEAVGRGRRRELGGIWSRQGWYEREVGGVLFVRARWLWLSRTTM